MQYHVISQKGNHRLNEDCYSIAEVGEWMLFTVADGVGGLPHGEIASELTVTTIESEVLQGASLEEAIKKADEAVVEKGMELGCNMGSTIVSCLFNTLSGQAIVAHVGDSRAYLVDEGGIWRTKDHTLVQELIDMGVLPKELEKSHPERSRLKQAVGIGGVEAEVCDCNDVRGKKLCLCTDGVSDVLEDEMIAEIVLNNEVRSACQQLSLRARECGSTDDITVVALYC